MTIQTILYFISILLTCALTGFLAWYAWRQPPLPGVRAYALLALSECLMALTDVISMLSGSQAQALFWFNLRFLFTATIPLIFLAFALAYAEQQGWLSKKLLAGALVIPLMTQIMLWSNSLHGLWVKQEVAFHQNGPFWIVETSARIPGLWFMVHSFYSQISMLAGMVLIFLAAWRMRRQYRGQALVLIAGALVGLAGSLIPTFNLIPQSEFNPFIPGIGISAGLYALAVFRFHFLERAPTRESAPQITGLDPQEKCSLAIFILSFILFASGLAAASYLTYQNYEKQFRAQVESQLSAIAALKADELHNWRAGRLADAEILHENPAFTALTQKFLETPEDAQAGAQLQTWLDSLRQAYAYERVFLLDTAGVERIASPAAPEPVAVYLTQEMGPILKTDQVTLLDFHRDSPGGPIRLALLVPIYSDQARSHPLGLLILRIDPQVYLNPFIQRWPVPSASAETLLVRREGEQVVYLNQLRFGQETALTLRFPLADADLPAARVARGGTGIIEGVDYRGQTVIADLRAVPDSPWFLVSKMDTAEVFAPLRERIWQTLLFFSVLVLAAGAGLVLAWRRQQVRFYQAQVETLNALRASEEKFRLAFDTSLDSVAITRLSDGMFVSVNKGFEQISGYTRQEVVGKTSAEINIWKDPEDRRKVVEGLSANGEVRNYEAPFLTRTGEIYGLMSATIIQLNGEPHILNITRDITERKRAEQALAASQKTLQDFTDNSTSLIYSIDTQGRFILINRHLESVLGVPRETMLGKTREAILPPEIAAAHWANDLKVIQTRQPTAAEEENLEPDGKHTYFSVKFPLLDSKDQIQGIGGISTDITERKQAEEEQRQSDLLFRALFELSPDAVVLLDPHDHKVSSPIIDCNAAACLMNGYQRDELIGQSIDIVNADPYTPGGQIAYLEKLREVGNLKLEVLHRHKNGFVFPVEVSTTIIKVGERELVIGIDRDITERKQAEKVLAESEERYRSLFGNMLNGFAYCQMLFDQGRPDDFIYLEVNRAFETLTGLKNVVGKKVSEVIPGIRESDPELIERYGRVALTGLPESFEIFVEGLEMWFFTSVYSPQKEYFVAVFDVITERKRAEQELKTYSEGLEARVVERTHQLLEVQEHLVRQERLATLGQLAGSIGHELRNPLGVISNAVYYLKMSQPEASNKVREYLEIIEKETLTSDKIISDLLDFTRIKSLDRQPVSVPELVAQTLERYPAPPPIQVALEIPAGLPQIYADPQQVIQVLGNLLTNACQAMIAARSLEQTKLTVSVAVQSDMICIGIQDTGPGIPPENMDKLFQPLFTTKTKGIGLGLAVSKKLAEANGGRIEVESTAGQGSTFRIYLPVYKE